MDYRGEAGLDLRMMTHILVGMGVTGYMASFLRCSYPCWILVLLSVIIVNIIIDAIGHYHGLFHPPRRSRLTHSLPGVICISLFIVFTGLRGVPLKSGEVLYAYLSVLVGGLSHWLLDALTPSGVYIVRRQFRLARIPYWNPVVNALLQVSGGVLLIYSVINALSG